jgi:hypothetical protein
MTNQVTEETLEHGLELFAELTSDIMNDAFQGALWLFPTAVSGLDRSFAACTYLLREPR